MGYPQTSDGKQIVLAAKFPGDVDPYFAGVSDDDNTIGSGIKFEANPSTQGEHVYEFSFRDWVYIAGGWFVSKNGKFGDTISMRVYAPATQTTSNPGAGNCNIQSGVIVPAAGDGSHDVSTTTFAPVPAFDPNGAPIGNWDWNMPDTGKGSMTPNAGAGQYHMLTTNQDLVYWMRKASLMGSLVQHLEPETKGRKIFPHWKLEVAVYNSSNTLLEVAWLLDAARKKTFGTI